MFFLFGSLTTAKNLKKTSQNPQKHLTPIGSGRDLHMGTFRSEAQGPKKPAKKNREKREKGKMSQRVLAASNKGHELELDTPGAEARWRIYIYIYV